MLELTLRKSTQLLGLKRECHGILGRADRLVILILTSLIYFILLQFGIIQFGLTGYEFTFFEYVMIYFAIAGNVTAIQRVISSWRKIKG